MPKSKKPESLEALQKKWYKKLEQSGFKDIETDWQHENAYFKERYSLLEFEARQRYFQLAGQLLHDYPFPNKVERIIWKRHAAGEKLEDIAKITELSIGTVWNVIQRIGACIKM